MTSRTTAIVAIDVMVDGAPGDARLRAAALRGVLQSMRSNFIRSTGGDNNRSLLRITILSDRDSWLNEHLPDLLHHWFEQGHAIRWIHRPQDLVPGDVCFLLGCGTILRAEQIARHRHTLAVHESELPRGRGWSPLTWQVLEGADRIPVTLFEATATVDAGPVYQQTWIALNGSELVDELRAKQADATAMLCREWVDRYPSVLENVQPQHGESTTYRRRTPKDSELDPHGSIADQFALLRVVDNERYPAFFSLNGERYVITIRKGTPIA